ncbi:MAG: M23 family peptidase [Bacteroidetes bacterium]|nr:MAG: M23 family peptidase [Bacteroidota bacterium]REK00722.1 MAG: M23 family peptidase [Bacteroidota bacterium]REK35156.1 MAG: M23 family peptidase [Bacteroidota bacterium]REK48233.1 MAG: M23 family peptidase [Bacteroidota bacterium]
MKEEQDKVKKAKLIRRLKSKYRLVVMNDETLEEKASFNLRPLNVFVTAGLSVIFLIILTIFIIAFTPIREYIPGYADLKTQRRVYNLVLRADSMEKAMAAKDRYIDNIRGIISGELPLDTAASAFIPMQKGDTVHRLKKSQEDSLLRAEIESRDPYSLSIYESSSLANSIRGFLFFPPVKGKVSSRFDPVTRHYGIDIVSRPDEVIKATLDGTVLLANFTSETGWVIGIQHSNNLFSLYKHNSALLKKVGDFVKAGEVIAIIGNSGELSSGPHLHFELWLNGTALNPLEYIAF